MKQLRAAWRSFIALLVTYPALISGYVIYAYLFLCIIRFFLLAEAGEVTLLRTYETFVALPFMWLLAFSLVKVIEVRTRLHDAETRALQAHQDLESKHLQLTTLHEVIRGVQDLVNNPLEEILLEADVISEAADENNAVTSSIHKMKISIRKISAALDRFNRSDTYHVEEVGAGLGSFAVPSQDAPT